MIADLLVFPSLVGMAMGFVAGYVAVRSMASLAAAMVFLFAVGKSPVRRETTLAEFWVALLRSALFCAVLYGAWLIANSMKLLKLDSEGFVCFVAVIFGLFVAGVRVPMAIELARAAAWEPGFAEELSFTPYRKRRLLLQNWRMPTK